MEKHRSSPPRKANRGTRRARASTGEVLGTRRAVPERVQSKWRSHWETLLALRDRLANRRGELVRDATEEKPAFSLHMADAGTDEFDRDFALSMAASEQNLLYEIEQAIDRVRSGTYGVCELSGKAIEPERLKAIPWARFSAEAEKEIERDGLFQRAKLAPLEGLPKSYEAEESEEDEVEEEI